MKNWSKDIAGQLGWTKDKLRTASGSIGALESTVEMDVLVQDPNELNESLDKLGSIPAHKEWSKPIEPRIVSGTPRWEAFRIAE